MTTTNNGSYRTYILNGCMRPERKLIIRQCTYELITATIPVFIAAGISSLVSPIIEYIAENHGDTNAVEIGLSFLYAILAYIIGKYFTYLLRHREVNFPDSLLIKRLKSEKLMSIFYSLFGENSAFAWKEFLVLFLIKLTYLEYGFGPSFGAWIMMLVVFLAMTTISVYTAKKIVKNHEIYHSLLEFSEDSFALSIAFTIISIVIYGLQGVRVHFTRKGGYIDSAGHGENEGEAADDDGDSSTGNSLYYLFFAFVVTTLVAIVIYVDTRILDCLSKKHPQSGHHHSEQQPKEPTHHHDHHDTVGAGDDAQSHTEHHHQTTWQDDLKGVVHKQWRNVLGCIAGVAWFTLILDCIVPPDTHSEQFSRIIGMLVVLLVVTWRAPPCSAEIIVKKERLEAKLKTTQERTREGGVNQAASASSSSSSFSFNALLNALEEFYYRVSLERKDAMSIAVRLTLGWTWEVFVITLIEYICEADHLSDGENLCIRLVSLCVVVVMSYGLHYMIRDWENIAMTEAKEETNATEAPSTTESEMAMNPMAAQHIER